MKKILALCVLCLSSTVFVATASAASIQLASDKVQAYSASLDAPLLQKLQTNSPLTLKDRARLEVIYQTKYVGEETLNPTQMKIYNYAKNILSSKTRKLIEKRANSQGM